MQEHELVPIIYFQENDIPPECGYHEPDSEDENDTRPSGEDVLVVQVLIRDYGSILEPPPHMDPNPWNLFFSSNPDEVRLVDHYFNGLGITPLSADPACSTRLYRGPRSAFETAFGIRFFQHPNDEHTYFQGHLKSPSHLAPMIIGVVGLCGGLLRSNLEHRGTAEPTVEGSYSYQNIRDYYQFPPTSKGDGETIAIITLGGGYYPSDITKTLEKYHIRPTHDISYKGANKPASMEDYRLWLNYWKLPVDGDFEPAKNNDAVDWTYETTMDLATVACLAPHAKIYLLNLSSIPPIAINNLINYLKEVQPTVVAASIGLNEKNNSFQDQVGRILEEYCATGGTAIFAAGNHGSNGGETELVVNFPSTLPSVIAAGGDTMQPTDSSDEYRKIWYTFFAERELMSGCGGVSNIFTQDLPWQAPYKQAYMESAGQDLKQGRAVPDLSMLSDNSIGPRFYAADELVTSGGTSLSTQISAAFFACIRQSLKEQNVTTHGLNHRIYSRDAARSFRGVTRSGSNWIPTVEAAHGPYTCAPQQPWNPCVGLGAPDGSKLLAALLTRSKSSPTHTKNDDPSNALNTKQGEPDE